MIEILMCGSSLSVKGGMVSVVRNYLGYNDWDNVNVNYIPTHIESNKFFLLFYFAFAYLRILFLLMTKKINVAHLHTAERGSFYRKALLVRTFKKMGVKTIMHHHGAEFELFYTDLSDKRKTYVKRILEMADLNIVLSQRLVEMITNKAPRANVKVLYNAVNVLDNNPYNSEAKNILFLGRLGKRKGIYDLLEAIKLLDGSLNSDVQFYLCGDGDVDEVKTKVDELGIKHRIAYVGWVDKEKKEELKSKTMINVLPSYNEGLPMTILETMAYGIPNISTSIASIPEVIFDGKNGYLITPRNVEMLAEYLKILSCDSLLRKNFSVESYELIKSKFSLKNNIKELESIYKTLM